MIELRLLKGRSVKLNLKHNIVHTLLSFSLLVFTTFSVADEPATQSAEALQAKADALGKQTFKRKNGQALSYEEIRVLPDNVKKEIFDNEMTKQEFDDYSNWKDKHREAQLARIAEMDKTHEAQLARIAEMDKNLAEINAQTEQYKKDIALIHNDMVKKSDALVKQYKANLANGKKLSPKDKDVIDYLLDPKMDFRKLGMKQATYDGLTELLRNPKNFE